MKRIETIKCKNDFNDIIKNGEFVKNNLYIIYIRKSDIEKPKYGIAISNKVGKAYLRNKLKRQTRSIIDKYRNLFKNNNNYIIMIRKSCAEADYQSKEKALKALIEK